MEFKITKEQIEDLSTMSYDHIPQKLKEWFPEAFKVKHKVGEWYNVRGHIFCITSLLDDGSALGYGIDNEGRWFNYVEEDQSNGYCSQVACNSVAIEAAVPATNKEVKEALIAEAKKRGYTTKNTKSIDGINMFDKVGEYYNFTYCDGYLHSQPIGGKLIFKDGKWAEIIPEPIELTLENIAEKFGVSVEEIKIKK